MENTAIGFIAASASVLAFGSQFLYTIRNKTTAGLSLNRSFLDVISLVFWIAYAARLEDIPLLIATSFELTTGIGVLVLIIRNRSENIQIKDFTPPQSTATNSEDSVTIDVRSRRYSI